MKGLNLLKRRPALPGLLIGFALAATACSPAAPASAPASSGGGGYGVAPTAPAAAAVPASPMPAAATATSPAPVVATATSPAAAIPATGNGLVQGVNSPQFGPILVTADGRTLYTNTFDSPGVSKCTDSACTSFWLPYLTDAQPVAGPGVTGVLGTLTRPDGSIQVTYNQMPLYTFAGDKQPGAISGDGISDMGGTWHVALVSAAPASSSTNSGGGSSGGGYGGGGGGSGGGSGGGGYWP